MGVFTKTMTALVIGGSLALGGAYVMEKILLLPPRVGVVYMAVVLFPVAIYCLYIAWKDIIDMIDRS